MKSLFLILKWVALCFILVTCLSFTNSRHAAQKAILNDIKIKSSEDNYVNREIILNYINLEKKLKKFFSKTLTPKLKNPNTTLTPSDYLWYGLDVFDFSNSRFFSVIPVILDDLTIPDYTLSIWKYGEGVHGDFSNCPVMSWFVLRETKNIPKTLTLP